MAGVAALLGGWSGGVEEEGKALRCFYRRRVMFFLEKKKRSGILAVAYKKRKILANLKMA